MSKKPPDPERLSLFENLLKGLSDFTTAFYEGLYPPEEEAQQRAEVNQRLDELEVVAQSIERELDQASHDRQATSDAIDRLTTTLEQLTQLQTQVIGRIDTMEQAGRPEEVAPWKALLQRMRSLLWLVLGVWTAEAIWQKVVQDEWEKRMPQIIEWMGDLLRSTEPALGPLESPLPAPELPPAFAAPYDAPLLEDTGHLRFDWVTIPAGWFWMGSDPARHECAPDGEQPYHRVYLPTFRIARVPVTFSQFVEFMRATGPSSESHWRSFRGNEIVSSWNYPVTGVDWHGAQAFCRWAKVRLPNEAEWEKAARGTEGRIYPWGNRAPTSELCNFYFHKGGIGTTPVGSYPAGRSPYGVLDMAGNVYEWTSSLYKKYPYDSSDGRDDPAALGDRVLRGGSFADLDARYLRCANRLSSDPVRRYANWGFRVCASPLSRASKT